MIGSERDSEACGLEGLHSVSGRRRSPHKFKSTDLVQRTFYHKSGASERFNCRETISRLRFPESIKRITADNAEIGRVELDESNKSWC